MRKLSHRKVVSSPRQTVASQGFEPLTTFLVITVLLGTWCPPAPSLPSMAHFLLTPPVIWSSDDDNGSSGVPGVSGCCCLPAEPCPEAVSPGFCLDPRLFVERRRECGREEQDQGIAKQNKRILEYWWHSASGSGAAWACRQSLRAGAWQGAALVQSVGQE